MGPDTADCGSRAFQHLYLPAGGWGWLLGQLAERSKLSQSWCQPAGGQGLGMQSLSEVLPAREQSQIPGTLAAEQVRGWGLRAGAGLLAGGLCPDVAGCGAKLVLCTVLHF